MIVAMRMSLQRRAVAALLSRRRREDTGGVRICGGARLIAGNTISRSAREPDYDSAAAQARAR